MAAILTTQESPDLRQRINTLIARGWTVSEIADRSGFARATVSRFVNEPAFGSPNVIAKLEALAEELEQSPTTSTVEVAPDGFIWTKDAREIAGICDLAATNHRLAVLVGYSGAGKTSTLDRIHGQMPDSVLVRVNPNMSCAGLCIRIGQQVGLDLRNGQSLDYMADSIIVELKARPRLVIIDEADYLVTRTSLRKFEILRTLYDEAQIGMVICGMPRLLHYLTAGPSMKENLAQFYSRVAYLRRLHGFSEEEIRTFCRQYPVDDEAMQLLHKLTRSEERGGLRRLDNLLRNASMLAQGNAITLRHVRGAAEELELTRQ